MENVLCIYDVVGVVGVVDVAIDRDRPGVRYAASYEMERKPWTPDSGGPDSAIYKTSNTDII